MITQTASTTHRTARSRWAAIGAAVAVTVGTGGMLTASAADDDAAPALFVATTPCRLIDTRAAGPVGGRAVALTANETYTTIVLGTHGHCTLPIDASTLVMNVTATNQVGSSHLTVFPTGSVRPVTSSLNWHEGSGDIANAVTANVSASGELSFFNLAGTTDIVADVVGYYTTAPLGNYYTKAEVAALIADNPGQVGPQGSQGDPGPQGDPGQGLPGDDGVDAAIGAAEFYAFMPSDNGATVPVFGAVDFPQNGPQTFPSTIGRISADQFAVDVAGLYRVTFTVPVTEGGQLAIALDGTTLPYTRVGRAAGTTQIVGDSLVYLQEGDIVEIRNDASTSALSITPFAGGTEPVVASLIFDLVQVGGPI